MLEEVQSVDYAAIHVAKKVPSSYPPGACTPLKRDSGPPNGEVVTIVEECPYIGR
jgi:hypothetical protein